MSKFHDTEFLEFAEQAVSEGLAIKKDDQAAIPLYSRIIRNSGKFEKALEQHEKLVKLDPDSALHWAGLGLIQQKLKNYKESVKSLEKAIELDAGLDPSYYILAVSYEKLGEKQKAINAVKKSIELRPDDKDAKELLNKLTENKDN